MSTTGTIFLGDHFCAGYDLKELAKNQSLINEEMKERMGTYGAMVRGCLLTCSVQTPSLHVVIMLTIV